MPDVRDACFLALLLAGSTNAERPRFGFEAGIAFPYAVRQSAPAGASSYGFHASERIYVHPAVFGLTLSYRLPRSLTPSAGALYGRVTHDESLQVFSVSGQSSVVAAQIPGTRWTVPILLKYRFARKAVSPFLGAGVSVDILENRPPSYGTCVYGITSASSFGCTFVRSTPATAPDHPAVVGGVIRGGVEIRLPVGRLAPELRFTRWAASHGTIIDAPRPNAQILLGLTL